jgi:hypothetical protein
MSSKPNSRCGGLSDDEIYNGKLMPKKRIATGNQKINSEEIFSQISVGNEASRGNKGEQV